MVIGTLNEGVAEVFVKPATGWANAALTATLTPSDGAVGFGEAVAISRTTVVVGAPAANVGSNTSQGAVYIFEMPSGGWTNMTETAKLSSPYQGSYVKFGSGVAIAGQTIVAGAPGASVQGTNLSGAGYVFSKPPRGWTSTYTPDAELLYLTSRGELGRNIAIANNTIVMSASRRLCIFVRRESGWINSNAPDALLFAQNGKRSEFLGGSVAISGDTIVAASSYPLGGAYVFVKPSTGWTTMTQTARLSGNSTPFAAISGRTIVVASTVYSVGASALVFKMPEGGWKTTRKADVVLSGSGSVVGDGFGTSLAISGGTIAVGAPLATVDQNYGAGAVYVFTQ
jgi:hypothetical protein